MIDLTIHYRASDSKRQRLPCLPRPGDYLTDAGRLWRVDAVVFGESSTVWGSGRVNIYCIEVDETRAVELHAAWASWGGEGGTP